MKYGERLKAARTHAHLTQGGLADKIGNACSQENISKLERGDAKGSEFTPVFARACGVDHIWLATGDGSMLPSSHAGARSNAETGSEIKLRHHKKSATSGGTFEIFQYEEVGGSMGRGVLLRDQPGQITGWKVTEEWAAKNIPANTGKENLCIVTGFGDSMRGMFNSGDPLIVDCGVKKLEYDGVYFFRVGDEGFIKRLQRIPGQGIRVISKNPDYETWTITPDMDFEVFGRVLKVWKSEEF